MVVVLVGVVAALLAVLANPLGIGHAGFGWKQGVLLAVGILLIIARRCGGASLSRQRNRNSTGPVEGATARRGAPEAAGVRRAPV
jgi:hypothetical protein